MKKYATLLPSNWLAETPQTLASRRLGRQSAERERISEINWNAFKEKTVSKLDLYGFFIVLGNPYWFSEINWHFFKTSGKLTFLQVCLKSEPKSIFDFGFFFWGCYLMLLFSIFNKQCS
ncbi:hypothetical protein [Peribacillus sp. NPDC096448]|uniref:hypothetical protein n=1 Tax=Peribacillus sp. NPDC096448 TaxID=3364395 RepID=UPI00382F5898